MNKIVDPETVKSYFHKLYENSTFIKELSEYELSEVAILADRVIDGRINAMKNKIAFMDPDQLGGGEPLNTYWQELTEGARKEGYSEKELLYYLLDKDDDFQKALTVDILIKDHKDSNSTQEETSLMEQKTISLKEEDKSPSVKARVVCLIDLVRQKKIPPDSLNIRNKLMNISKQIFPGTKNRSNDGRAVYNEFRPFIKQGHWNYEVTYRQYPEDIEAGRKLAEKTIIEKE